MTTTSKQHGELTAACWSVGALDATPAGLATTGNQFRLAADSEWHFNLDTKGN